MAQNQDNRETLPEGFPMGLQTVNLKGTPVPITQVLEEIAPQGDRVKKVDLVGRQITLLSMHGFVGDYGPALFVIGADEDGELFNTIIGNRILMEKLMTVRGRLPVTCTIVRIDKGEDKFYYDFE